MHTPTKDYYKPEVVVLYGPTGMGKSRMARSYSDDYFVKTSITEKWWDGYDNQETIIWDDFRPTDIKFNQLLILIDGYGAQVQVKGAVIWLKPKKWIFTTNKPPTEWYTATDFINDEDTNQLLRRITNTFYVDSTFYENFLSAGLT